MLPHQQRVIDEKDELEKKIKALDEFIIINPIFITLDTDEQYRLRKQVDIMWQYLDILEARVEAFSKV